MTNRFRMDTPVSHIISYMPVRWMDAAKLDLLLTEIDPHLSIRRIVLPLLSLLELFVWVSYLPSYMVWNVLQAMSVMPS